MTQQKVLFSILILSIWLTALGYMFDSDPPYPNMQDTVMEFVCMSGLIFTIIAIFYWFSRFLLQKLTN